MSSKPKVTIHDIAEKLNITASTVSRALNDHPRISEATKKSVQKLAKSLNYQPNNIAAALRNGKTNIIGIIVPTADRAFFASVIRGIEEIANKLNYRVIISQSNDNYEKEVQTIDALLSARVDGIIASIGKNTENFDHYKRMQEKSIPLVLFDRTTDELEVSQVMIDDYLGAYKVVEHLIQQGARRIAHFTSPKKVSVFKERLRGYVDALRDYEIPYDESLVIKSNLDQKDGMERQMNALSNMGLLSRFVGMLTDSRSFLSYPRHEYFRRILCNMLGNDVESGQLPASEMKWIGQMVEDICYNNAKNYFNF